MINLSKYSAIIFDMDGVIVDNHTYHLKAWGQFCNMHGYPFDIESFSQRFFGKSNHDVLNTLSGKILSTTEIENLGEEKELIYRNLYSSHIKPLKGLAELLSKLKMDGKLIAIASSAPISNIDFVLNALNIRVYFDIIVDVSMVTESKPNPDIYLKAANLLKVSPNSCLVFEDSHSGIKAAQAAEMDVIAVATTHKKEELDINLLKISDFEELMAAN